MNEIEKSSINSLKSKKFNKKHLLLFLIGLLITLSLLGIAQYSSAQNAQKAQESFTLATKFFNEANIKEAKKNIEDALALKPNNSDYKKFTTRIENAEESLEGITNAEQLIENGKLQEALEVLNTADSPDLGIDVKSSFLIEKITPTILAKNQIQIQKYIRSKQFSDAKEKLDSLIVLYAGKKDVSDKLKQDYNLISDLEKKESRKALAKLSKRYDKFEDITWYKSSNSPRYTNSNAFYIYFGLSGDSKLPLRLVVQYESDDWLFIESAEVNVDGENYSISGDWERDNNSRIWEWIDETLDDREMVEAIIKSKSAVIRFEGDQYYNTRTITATQKQSMQDVLLAYDGLR